MNKLAISGGEPVGAPNIPSWPLYDEREILAVKQVVESGIWGTNGPKKEELEKAFASFCGCDYAIAATNGTHTIRLALEALGIGPGDEVIVPGLTWQATAASVLDVNAVPVLVDIDPETYTIDPEAVEAAITARTRCIIPVHLYGCMADMDALTDIANRYGLDIIEDCAHQHGSSWRGTSAGTIGIIGSFSLQASKILTSGEGGLLTTNDRRLAETLQALTHCGRRVDADAPSIQSGNYRMGEFQAAIACAQLERLAEQNRRREQAFRYLEERITDIEGIRPMYRHPAIQRQAVYLWTLRYASEAWHDVPVQVFMKALESELCGKVSIMGTYEPLNNCPLYRPLSKKTHKWSDEYCRLIEPSRFDLPVCTRAYTREAVNFLHTTLLTDEDSLDLIVDAIAKIRESSRELIGR